MELDPKSRILIVNLGGIGDLFLSTAALKALRRRYPAATLDILAVARNLDFLRSYGLLDRLWAWPQRLPAMFGILFRLRREHYDLVVNMRTMVSFPSAIKIFCLFRIVNGRIAAGRDTNRRGFFLNIRIPEDDIGRKHEMEYDIDTVQALGAPVSDRKLEVFTDRDDEQALEQLLRQSGVADISCLIGVHPGGRPSRRWPADRFAAVIRRLAQEHAGNIVLTGGRDEAELTEEISRLSGVGPVNLAGRLTFGQMTVLLKKCRLLITNDTGPLHIAAALGTPLIAILGPGDPTRYDPRRISDQARVFYHKTECGPCNRMECRSLKCLKATTADEVTAAALDMLRSVK